MKKLLLTLAFVLFAGYADAGKFWAQPECPYTGHATCSDNKDNDLDGVKDEAAPAAAFGAVTDGYAADIAECQLLTYVATTDAESISGDSAQKTGTYRQGQIGCTGNFTNGSYTIRLRARVPVATSTEKRVVWVDTSPFTRSWQNSKASLLFLATNGVSSVMAWSGTALGEGLNFNGIGSSNVTDPHSTTTKTVALNGNGTIYLTADEAVKFDCIFISTNASAIPLCPDESDTAPQAGTITVSSVTSSGFTASWDYDTESADDGDCFLNYGTVSGSLTSQSATAASAAGTCSRPITGLAEGTIYFMRGTSDGGVDGSSQTPQTSVQTSVQTTGPIRWAQASGGSTSANCLDSGTKCTLTRAINQAVAGDTIKLANGNYPLRDIRTVRSGTLTQPITITAENEHLARITPAASTSGGLSVFHIIHSHIVLKNIEIDGNSACCWNGITTLGTSTTQLSNITIENMRVLNMNGKAFFMNWVNGGASKNIIWRWNYANTTGTFDQGEGFYIASTSTALASNIQIYANTLEDISMECFDLKRPAANIEIHHNICDGSGYNTVDGLFNGDPNTGATVFTTAPNSNNRVHNNIFRGYKTRNYGGCVTGFDGGSGLRFDHNVCRDSLSPSLAVGANAAAETNKMDLTIDFNTWCGLSSSSISGDAGSFTIANNTGLPAPNAAGSVCDSEEARIIAERDLLPGNPN